MRKICSRFTEARLENTTGLRQNGGKGNLSSFKGFVGQRFVTL